MMHQDLCWGESNAVVYANSVWGARTEKYADYLDLCGALAGIVPYVGVHVVEQRQPRIVLDASPLWEPHGPDNMNILRENDLNEMDLLFPLLGHLCGSLSDGKVPILIGLESLAEHITTDHLKAFCAAFGTTASSPLIHIAGVTPEAQDPKVVQSMVQQCGFAPHQRRTIHWKDLEATFVTLDSGDNATTSDDRVHLVALGNPHLSVTEVERLAALIQSQDGNGHVKKHPNVRIMACMSRQLYQQAKDTGHIQVLEDFGVEFVNDTCWCMLLDPPIIPTDPHAKIMTNSGKYSHYGPGLTGRQFRLGSLEDCYQTAATGRYTRVRRTSQGALPPGWWMTQKRRYSVSSGFLPTLRMVLRKMR